MLTNDVSISMEINITCEDEYRNVTSGDIISHDKNIFPSTNDIIIVRLCKGQSININLLVTRVLVKIIVNGVLLLLLISKKSIQK